MPKMSAHELMLLHPSAHISILPDNALRAYEIQLSEVSEVYNQAERKLLELRCQTIPEHHLEIWDKRMDEANRRMKLAKYKSENAQLAVSR